MNIIKIRNVVERFVRNKDKTATPLSKALQFIYRVLVYRVVTKFGCRPSKILDMKKVISEA